MKTVTNTIEYLEMMSKFQTTYFKNEEYTTTERETWFYNNMIFFEDYFFDLTTIQLALENKVHKEILLDWFIDNVSERTLEDIISYNNNYAEKDYKVLKEICKKYKIKEPKLNGRTNKKGDNPEFRTNKQGRIIFLNLNYKKLKEIPEWIKKFNRLVSLHVACNDITEIKNLNTLIHLKNLDLSNNKIEKIEWLENLINLKVLLSQNNKIKKIEWLENLKDLWYLCIQDNKIKKIEWLENLKDLWFLYLNFNKIEKLENIKENKKLMKVWLEGNPLKNTVKCGFWEWQTVFEDNELSNFINDDT